MDQFIYKVILQDIMEPFANDVLLKWIYKHDIGLKGTGRSVKKWLSKKNICFRVGTTKSGLEFY